MSIGTYSLASGRDPESSYANSSTYEINDRSTPITGLQESSHDEYTPTRVSTRESASIIFTTPTHRSASAGLSSKTRKALEKLYDRNYGARHCLVTSSAAYLVTVAHAVQRASKSDLLTLYEYCLGLDLRSFHVDSRRNMFYLSPHLHGIFDAGRWFLLPDTGTLRKVYDYVKDAVASRANSQSSKGTKHFWLEWNLNNKTPYTFILLPGAGCPRISCEIGGGVWEDHSYPYQGLPLLECHIAPPFAVINAGPKCTRDHINQIAREYCSQQTSEFRKELEERLTLLCNTWALFEDAKKDAKDWEVEKMGKRKRDRDDKDIENLSRGSKRITRSQARSAHDGTPKSDLHSNQARDKPPPPGPRKRKLSSSLRGAALTDDAVFHLEKRQKRIDLRTRVRRWVTESTRASSLDPEPYA
ncbi:uncharacterized protein HD556DRAFT_772765 [Suillus plorans]|uniref:HNH nuclease domain-containing protein n=1 Tax=Suillus plorans TaxID=116603 RepID=A0A9P7DEU0_9AGAM|nr:uncharacterized protein HD556DRAFT_772765 [Suillus plorans]KAG1789661.1 hypothetical protein HD556DRAFT_772765 [Suillus plorans]